MENEVWKDIVGYEGLYQVSNLGRVKSLKRKVYAGRNRMRWQYERILSNNKTNGNGYIVVSLNKESKSKNKYVHRLVAEAFLENPNNYKYINHKDQNTFNNNVNNLEFCTAQYNSTYRDAHIKRGLKHRNNLVNSKKVYQLDENENIIKEFPSMAEANRQLGTNHTSIYACINGKQKHAFGYKWKYADEELQKWNGYDKIYLHLTKTKSLWLVGGKDLTTFRW